MASRYTVQITMKDGTRFNYDFIQRALVETQDPNNKILLTDKMSIEEGGYWFLYDPKTKNIATPEAIGNDIQGLHVAKVRGLTYASPGELSFLYGVPLTYLEGKSDTEFFKGLPAYRNEQYERYKDIYGTEHLEQRLLGQLPEIKIGIRKYTLDWANRQMMNVDDAKEILRFSDLAPQEGGYNAFFNLKTGKAYRSYHEDVNLDECVIIDIPHERILDSVAVARECGFKDTDLLGEYPYKKEHRALLVAVHPQAAKLMIDQKRAEEQNITQSPFMGKGRKFGLN